MSQFVDTHCRVMQCSAGITQYLRVVRSAGKVAAAGAADKDIGVAWDPFNTADDYGPVRLRSAMGTTKMVASGSITIDAVVYGAAAGKIAATANGNPIGVALEAATANNDVIEVLRFDSRGLVVLDEVPVDDTALAFGASSDAQLLWSTGDADNHSFVAALGNSNQALHITDVAALATDWDVSADTHPTVYIHSNTTPATDYIKLGVHDGSACWLGDMIGGASIYVGFDGLECLELAETGSAVNHIRLTNAATGNMPKIAAGGEADTGIIFENVDAEEILILDSVASSVNEITIKSAATGNKPIIAATGEADTGIEFHNDQAEEILILASAATSVNELTITSAATAAAVAIATTGDDTDVGLTIDTKGAGDITVTAGNDLTLQCGDAISDVINLTVRDVDGTADVNMVVISSANVPSILICPAATQTLGFFGATPVVQQPKANYNNWAAATDVAGALAALGLVDAA